MLLVLKLIPPLLDFVPVLAGHSFLNTVVRETEGH